MCVLNAYACILAYIWHNKRYMNKLLK